LKKAVSNIVQSIHKWGSGRLARLHAWLPFEDRTAIP